MKHCYRSLISFFLTLISFHLNAACLSGTKTVGSGGDYPSFNGATGLFNAINTLGLSGNLMINVISDITETATTPLSTITYCSGGPYHITIQAINNDWSITCNMPTALVSLSGARQVNFGGGLHTLSFINHADGPVFIFDNDAQNNVVSYCRISGEGTTASSAIIKIGNGGSIGNSFNGISNNIIGSNVKRAADAIYCSGSLNSSNQIIGNKIFNFSEYGIGIAGAGPYWIIEDNILYDNLGSCPTSQFPIYFNGGSSSYSNVISGNKIGGTDDSNNGTWVNSSMQSWSIFVFAGGNSYSKYYGSTKISRNTVKNFRMSDTGATGDMDYRSIYTGAFSLYQTADSARGYYIIGGPNKEDGNIIGDSADLKSIWCDGDGDGKSSNPAFYGIVSESLDETVISQNQVYSIYTTGLNEVTIGIASGVQLQSSRYKGLSLFCGKTTIRKNIISNFHSNSLLRYSYYAQGSLVGISLLTQNNNCLVDSNVVTGLNSIGKSTNAHTAVVAIGADAFAPGQGGGIISKNMINKIENTNGAAGDTNFTIGIANGKAMLFFGNQHSGSFSVVNNMINLSPDSAWDNDTHVWGILNMAAGTNNAQRYYYNTVLVGGKNKITGTNSSAAFISLPGLATKDIAFDTISVINNIFINSRTGGGKHSAISSNGWAYGRCDYNFYATNDSNTVGEWIAGDSVYTTSFRKWRSNATVDANTLFARLTTSNKENIDTVNFKGTVNIGAGYFFQDPADIWTPLSFLHIPIKLDTSGYLYVARKAMDLTNLPLYGDTTDIDHKKRHKLPGRPDIGADEFCYCQSQPKPVITVLNNCEYSELSCNAVGALYWNTGETTSSIEVSEGIYAVTLIADGCATEAKADAHPLNLTPAPNIIAHDTCGFSVLSTDATGDLLWSTGETTSSIIVTDFNFYSLTLNASLGCPSDYGYGYGTPVIFDAPVIEVNDSCEFSILSAPWWTDLLWSTGETTETIMVSAGQYSLRLTLFGCISEPGYAYANPKPALEAPTIIETYYCDRTELKAIYPFGGHIDWLITDNWGTRYFASGDEATITDGGYSIITAVRTWLGCSSVSDEAWIWVFQSPSPPALTASDDCGESLLSASSWGWDLKWNTGETTNQITVTNAGMYSATVTYYDYITCSSKPTTIYANPKPIPPTPNVIVNEGCEESDLEVINSEYADDIEWGRMESWGYHILGYGNKITVTESDWYSVKVTSMGCSSVTEAFAWTFSIPPQPIIMVTNDCGESILEASYVFGDYLEWSTGETTNQITVTDAGMYSLTQAYILNTLQCTSEPGYGYADPFPILTTPILTLTDYCGISILKADYSGPGYLEWTTSIWTEDNDSIIVTDPGLYAVRVYNDPCYSDPAIAYANPKPIPPTPNVFSIDTCGHSVLSTDATGSLLWSTGETTSSIVVTDDNWYLLTQTTSLGCSSDYGFGYGIPFEVPAAPLIEVNDKCGFSELTIPWLGDPLWSTGETTETISVSAPGQYSVFMTTVWYGCASEPGYAYANPKPALEAPTIIETYYCDRTELKAIYPFGGHIDWLITDNLGTRYFASGNNATVTELGYSYINAERTWLGCTSVSETAWIWVFQSPSPPALTASDDCGESLLSASSWGWDLKWNTGETTTQITVTNTGMYSATVSYSDYITCTSEPATIYADPKPIPPTPVVFPFDTCGYSVLLTDATGDLLWSTGETTSSILVTDGGYYFVNVNASSGCSSDTGFAFSSPVIVEPPIIWVHDTCGPSTLIAGWWWEPWDALLWSTGETSGQINVSAAGQYSAIITRDGCTGPPSYVNANPKPPLPKPTFVEIQYCDRTEVEIKSPGFGYVIQWSAIHEDNFCCWYDAGYGNKVTLTHGGYATKVVAIATAPWLGCSSSAETVPWVNEPPPPPELTVINDCGKSLLSAASWYNVKWNTEETTSEITVSDPGMYSASVPYEGFPNLTCTSETATIYADPIPTPPAPLVTVFDTCLNSVLSTNATGMLSWSPGNATTSSITVSTAGTYSVTQSVNNCISAPGFGTASPKTCEEEDGHNLFLNNGCGSYINGKATDLITVCSNTKKNKVLTATPGTFSYTATITAPSSSFCIEIVQAKSCSDSLAFFNIHQDNQAYITDAKCNKIKIPDPVTSVTPTEQVVKLCISSAIAGSTYIVSVKYDPRSLAGTIPAENCTFTFFTRIAGITVSNSRDKLTVSECHNARIADASGMADDRDMRISAFPNPFNTITTLNLSSEKSLNNVVVELYDMKGNRLEELYNGAVAGGNGITAVQVEGKNLADGVYIFKVSYDGKLIHGRLVLIK